MIYAELTGGLGNQMFVYAFARALSLRCNEPTTLIDRRESGGPAHTACALDSLCLCPEVGRAQGETFAKHHLPLQNLAKVAMIRTEQRTGMMARDWNHFECGRAPLLNALGLHFSTDGFVPCHRGRRPKDFLAWGYFQSEEYFADYKAEILAELRPLADFFDDDLCREIAAETAPVCVHLRRGDYLSAQNAAFAVCTPAYYAAAVRQVAEQVPCARLFVFSDDPAWAKQHLDTAGLPAVFVPGGASAVQDLARMQGCRHFVLSNSTFSWWAQELARANAAHAQTKGVVAAPARWYSNEKQTALYAKDWVLVPV